MEDRLRDYGIRDLGIRIIRDQYRLEMISSFIIVAAAIGGAIFLCSGLK